MVDRPDQRSTEGNRAQDRGLARRAARFVGSCALLLVMALDAASVVGRGLSLPLLGALELIEACIVVVAACALIEATAAGAHASVSILVERLASGWRELLARGASLLSLLFVAWLAVGSLWLAADLWNSHERTELLELPLWPLRALWCASLLLVAQRFLRRAWPQSGRR